MWFDAVFSAVSSRFRRRRMQRFMRELAITAETRVLDVGGTPEYWNMVDQRPHLTFLNMPYAIETVPGVTWVAGDGRQLPFRDGAFDVVFSNSVIEHVGNAESQRRFATEIARVGRAYWVQTPNRGFPLEQHLLTPFIHWLPAGWQRAIVPRFTVWSAITKVGPDRRRFFLEHYLTDLRLLTAAELCRLLPGAALIRERWCGITKSLVAFMPTESSPRAQSAQEAARRPR